MASPIQCDIHEREESLYLCLAGDLDQHSFLPLSQALAGRTLDQPVKVDLHEVTFADIAGLRALVLLQRQVRQAGVQFVLIEPSSAVRTVFRRTGLLEMFRIDNDDPDNPCS